MFLTADSVYFNVLFPLELKELMSPQKTYFNQKSQDQYLNMRKYMNRIKQLYI